MDFFNSPALKQSSIWSVLPKGGLSSNPKVVKLRTTLTNLDIFDKFEEKGAYYSFLKDLSTGNSRNCHKRSY